MDTRDFGTRLLEAQARIAALERENEDLREERAAILEVLGCPDCALVVCDEHREQLDEGLAALKGAK